MTPAQQIADEIRAGEKILAEIVAGLDGVTPGPWETDTEKMADLSPPHHEYALFNAEGHRLCGTENHDYRFGEIHTDGPDEDGFFYDWNEPARKLMEHLARCHPDALRSIDAAMQAKDARIAACERDRKERIEQCDRMAEDWSDFCEEIGVRWDTHEAVAYELHIRKEQAEEAMQAKDARFAELAEQRDVLKEDYQREQLARLKAEAALAAMTAERDELLDGMVKVEKAGESIRLILMRHLNEPIHKAFWAGVAMRDIARAFLAKHKEGGENG